MGEILDLFSKRRGPTPEVKAGVVNRDQCVDLHTDRLKAVLEIGMPELRQIPAAINDQPVATVQADMPVVASQPIANEAATLSIDQVRQSLAGIYKTAEVATGIVFDGASAHLEQESSSEAA